MAFCAGPYLRYTKWVAKYVLGLRKEMSIRAVAQFTGLHWDSVKQIEKTYLLKKHKKPALTQVQYLSIDEVYLGKKLGYITVVRDLLSDAVLFIGKEKRLNFRSPIRFPS
jgi:transposase